jgi:hypothetical protein
MTTSLRTNDSHTLVCKHLPDLPPVVCDWQQSCQQPCCPHYCQGECCHPGRQRVSDPCPLDGQELLWEEADDTDTDSPWWATGGFPKKG